MFIIIIILTTRIIVLIIYYLAATDSTRDILTTWSELSPQYPRLARMARDILAIPGTGVSVERIFSLARITWRHNQPYSPDTFRAVMLIHHFEHREDIRFQRGLLQDIAGNLGSEEAEGELAESEELQRQFDEADEIMETNFISDVEEDIPSQQPMSRLSSASTALRKQKGRTSSQRDSVDQTQGPYVYILPS